MRSSDSGSASSGLQTKPNLASIQHANGFLEGFFEAAANSHNFAHGTHLWTNMAVGILEFLQVPAGDFNGYVVEGWFEAGGCDFGDFVDEFRQGVAEGEFCCYVSKWVTCDFAG